MGDTWVGFQTSPKAGRGETHVASLRIGSALPDAQVVALLTTAEGLQRWLGTPTRFELRRGASMRFADGAQTYGGSYTVVDIPRRVVIVTERHGEIDIRLDLRASELVVTLRRFIPEHADAVAVLAMLDATLAALRQECSSGE